MSEDAVPDPANLRRQYTRGTLREEDLAPDPFAQFTVWFRDAIEAKVRERVKKQLLPNAKVDLTFERRRPPLESSPASVALGRHAQGIYREMGMDLVVDAVAEGGGTDAAFAALKTKNAVVERFGLRGFGAHSSNDEYILIPSIEPRLYLAARVIMDLARDKVR